ncbi:dienelactone hydrolase [Magnetococcus marinus MC-1]|uniref:Dienelactone hydrolase n=1 Tax=Magnetococcus marinus (strain ATCC BAA-1437 / JCM 17883 / MC-1) TaxID=156889 RepID=A0L4I0_MAGMM|nr:dienelactone hydrolase family protein [Magnetococcus marinus]ABK42873.1 dienelactone hydrolase [Magnetococcus marinus MC-1]
MRTYAKWMGVALALLWSVPAWAVVQEQEVPYKDGDTGLAGYLVWDDAFSGKRPGVLVVHEWWGLNSYAKSRARQLARMGYIAFAADMYGEGHVTEHAKEAKGWMQQVTANVEGWRRRADLALEQLKAAPQVDTTRLAAVGYCFGGGTVMQMAYGGSDLLGVASFHGPLPPAEKKDYAKIKAKIFVAHGDADTFVPLERLEAFRIGLNEAGADWQLLRYGGAVHSFTNPAADGSWMPTVKYDAKADHRSWAAFTHFLDELFWP